MYPHSPRFFIHHTDKVTAISYTTSLHAIRPCPLPASTNPELRDTRVMVAPACGNSRCPVIDVHMLDPDPAAVGDRGRDEHVIELLRVLVEQVRVALDGGHVRGDVDLDEQVFERREDGARQRVLVVVARNDDVRVRV